MGKSYYFEEITVTRESFKNPYSYIEFSMNMHVQFP